MYTNIFLFYKFLIYKEHKINFILYIFTLKTVVLKQFYCWKTNVWQKILQFCMTTLIGIIVTNHSVIEFVWNNKIHCTMNNMRYNMLVVIDKNNASKPIYNILTVNIIKIKITIFQSVKLFFSLGEGFN